MRTTDRLETIRDPVDGQFADVESRHDMHRCGYEFS